MESLAEADLVALSGVIAGPLSGIASRLSRFIADSWPHAALVIFTHECTGRPRKVAGATSIIGRVTIGELEKLVSGRAPGEFLSEKACIGGVPRWVWLLRDHTGTLLVLVPRATGVQLPRPQAMAAIFSIVATSIKQQVAQASPEYLAESRAASTERTRTIAELTASHEAALITVLNILRSAGMTDTSARAAAADSASQALVALRATQSADHATSEESAVVAFSRLRKEIRQQLRHHPAQIDFVPPSRHDGALPGEIAYAARAMTRAAVLAFSAQSALTRLRIAWTRDDTSLTIDIRDNESGSLDTAMLRRQLQGRAQTLGAELHIETIPKWGSRVTVQLPLESPAPGLGGDLLAALNRREREVLQLITAGKRNKAIAAELGVAESTVKFHVAGIFRKLQVGSRAEAVALGLYPGHRTISNRRTPVQVT